MLLGITPDIEVFEKSSISSPTKLPMSRGCCEREYNLTKRDSTTMGTTIESMSLSLQNSKFQNYHIEREFYMYGVLNLDEIKNKLYNLFINCKTNIMSLIRL